MCKADGLEQQSWARLKAMAVTAPAELRDRAAQDATVRAVSIR